MKAQQPPAGGMQFLPGTMKDNQLEFDSASEYNSVMGQSPVKSSAAKTHRSRRTKEDAKSKIQGPNANGD